MILHYGDLTDSSCLGWFSKNSNLGWRVSAKNVATCRDRCYRIENQKQ